jgi:hypothetical protein
MYNGTACTTDRQECTVHVFDRNVHLRICHWFPRLLADHELCHTLLNGLNRILHLRICHWFTRLLVSREQL